MESPSKIDKSPEGAVAIRDFESAVVPSGQGARNASQTMGLRPRLNASAALRLECAASKRASERLLLDFGHSLARRFSWSNADLAANSATFKLVLLVCANKFNTSSVCRKPKDGR